MTVNRIKRRYVDEHPHRYHRHLMSVFVSAGLISAPGTPCVIKKGEDRRKKKEEVLHLFRCYTLAQKHLIELLMWNASDVQRQHS